MMMTLSMAGWFVAAWLCGLVGFFIAQRLLGAHVTVDMRTVARGVAMWPLAAPAFVVFLPAVSWIKRRSSKPLHWFTMLVTWLVMSALVTLLTVFVLFGSAKALSSQSGSAAIILRQTLFSREAVLLLALYSVTAFVFLLCVQQNQGRA
jgi:hypothetical protein